MPLANRRSRSTTTASTQSAHAPAPRPVSRGSTTSMHSAHALNFDHAPRPTSAYSTQQTASFGPPDARYLPIEAQHHPDVQPGNNGDGSSVDPQLAAWHHQYGSAATYAMPHGITNGQQPDSQHSFDMQGIQYNYGSQSAPTQPAETDGRKKGSASSATNDKELRQILAQNEGRTLKDVAGEVVATERTSRAEKTKQLFAMIWLRTACRSSKTSVPRSRVYTSYAERCATERVVPLNPASFGKLVRVIFPGLQTRRLGVRGESKYHYVDLALVDDPQNEYDYGRNSQAPESRPSHSVRNSAIIDFNSLPRLPADTASFSAIDGAADHRLPPQPEPSGPASQGRLFAHPYGVGMKSRIGNTSTSYKQILKFPPAQDSMQESESIDLPNIHNYVPPKTDIDAALSLAALYRTHCTSLVDCIRYCKEKQFFRLYGSFGGTLTVPVQKLFDHPAMAPWIRECDWMMYQKMTYFVSQLTLAVVPKVVLQFLDTISKNLHGHISKIFADRPVHVLEAKLEPATLFAGLLHRMLRVNGAAHAAAALLMTDQYRDQMWQDWVAFVNPKRIMESELPDCGYDEVYKILTYDVRTLLLPLNTPNWVENDTDYADAAAQQAHLHAFNPAISGETVIDRIAAFLADLPARFPEASARTILHCISAVGTAALREITVENGCSYNPWWITKVFIDEMGLWLASLGGFLDHKPPGTSKEGGQGSEEVTPLINGLGGSRAPSRSLSRHGSMASPELGAGMSVANEQGITQASNISQQQQTLTYHEHSQQSFMSVELDRSAAKRDDQPHESEHDDSGVGMSMLDDSGIDLHKYDMPTVPMNMEFNSAITADVAVS